MDQVPSQSTPSGSLRLLLSLLAGVYKDSKLKFSGIQLTKDECFTLGKFLPHCKQFEVDLSNCSIGAKECKRLFRPDAKYDIKSLKYVILVLSVQ